MDRIKNLNNYEQNIIYYGPTPLKTLVSTLSIVHKVPTSFAVPPVAKSFKQIQQTKNEVLFTDYDMVQAETRWIRNTDKYDESKSPLVTVFNNYFGGGMGSVVFQTIRESKALAYSTYGYYINPQKAEDEYYMLGYVGSQADKFKDATVAMNELLTTLPELPVNLDLAKVQVKKDIQTERITQDNIIYNYLSSKQLGLNEDPRKKVYSNVDTISMTDLKNFHSQKLSGKSYTYAIVASEKKVPMDEMKKLGEVKKISLEELFGY
jgi:predicted Zn-dependent peptidase